MTIIPTLLFFFRGILTGGHEVGAIYYCIDSGIGKTNRWLLALFSFPILVATLPVKYPCPTTIIARGLPLVLIVVAGHGGCCNIFGIRENRILSNPFWKPIFGLLVWVTTRFISLWPAVFIDMEFLPHLLQVISDLSYDPPPDPLPFPLQRLLKWTCFKALLIDCSMATVYAFGREGWSWEFSLLVSGSHCF